MISPAEPQNLDRLPGATLPEVTYRALFDAVGDAILVTDEQGRYLDANAAAGDLLGYTRHELRAMSVSDVVARDPAWAESEFARFAAAGSWRDEVEVRRKDGTTVTVESHATRVERAHGPPVFVAVLRDLSQQKRAEEQQRRRAERLRQLTDAMPVLVGFVDAQQRYFFNNRAYEDWLGLPRAQITGRRLVDVLGERAYAVLKPFVERALGGERVAFEASVPYPDRTRYVAATYVPYIEDDGRVLGYFSMVDDLSERKRAEDAMRLLADASAALVGSLDSEATLRRLAEIAVPSLADACVVDILDPEGALRRVAVASIDLPKAAWVWDVAQQPLDPDAQYGPAYVLRTGEPELVPEVTDEFLARAARSAEHLQRLKESRVSSHMIVPLRARGRVLGALTFASTRSRRRFGPEDLALAEEFAGRTALALDNARLYEEAQAALKTRDDVLSSVSHDLRTPITSIKGRAQVLMRRMQRGQTPTPETVRETLAAIDSIADRMNALVDELVDSGRLESGRPLDLILRPVDLVRLARDTVTEAQRTTAKHQIRVESAEEELLGEWDAVRLERVLSNLLSNAIRYAPQGGDVLVSVVREGESAALAVQDRGVGIPAADLPHIFERFRRGRNVTGRIAGSGIGLAGARQIVEQHGGSIAIESKEGAGTTVTVKLPLTEMMNAE